MKHQNRVQPNIINRGSSFSNTNRHFFSPSVSGRFYQLLFLLLLVFAFTRCGIFKDNTAVIWTDHYEIANIIELYNATHEDYQVILKFKHNAGAALKNETDETPDLVVDSNLWNSEVKDAFIPLNSIFEEEKLNSEIFYQNLLDRCRFSEEKILMLPVSFNLGGIMFKRSTLQQSSKTFIFSLEELMKTAKQFNSFSRERFYKIGFSPLWSNQFIYFSSKLFDTNFHEKTNSLVWNESSLNKSMSFLSSWIKSANRSLSLDFQFTNRYLYYPAYQLINNERIQFSFTTIRDFFTIPEGKRNGMELSWIARNDTIPVQDDVLLVGIPIQASSKEAAKNFLIWLYQEKTNKEILEKIQNQDIRTFGIAGGFSALPAVNERVFPSSYPFLVGNIPPEDFLQFPPPLPLGWKDMRQKAVLPYLERRLKDKDPPDLNAFIEGWNKQRGK